MVWPSFNVDGKNETGRNQYGNTSCCKIDRLVENLGRKYHGKYRNTSILFKRDQQTHDTEPGGNRLWDGIKSSL